MQKPVIKVGSICPNNSCQVLRILNDGVFVRIGGKEFKISFKDCEAIYEKN